MTTPPRFGAPGAGPWVQRWLSPPRHAVYLAAAANDPERALALYEWNAQLSAALLRDLAHVEVGLRNAYDTALVGQWPGPPHWTSNGEQVFAPLFRTKSGHRVDVNSKPRESLRRAVASAGGASVPPGKVIAELTFGFWRYLSSAAHEKTLWVRCLYRSFPPGTDRRDVDGPVGRVHNLRNRVAHHEPLLQTNVAARLADLVAIATFLDADLGRHLTATTTVTGLLETRP